MVSTAAAAGCRAANAAPWPATAVAVESRIHPVLVVDEAQHLRNDVLEDLRLLTNYAMDSEPRLCLLLVGLTELRRRLSMAVHESLAQRVVVRYHLSGLARVYLGDYGLAFLVAGLLAMLGGLMALRIGRRAPAPVQVATAR